LSAPIPQLTFTFPNTLGTGETNLSLVVPADTNSGYSVIGVRFSCRFTTCTLTRLRPQLHPQRSPTVPPHCDCHAWVGRGCRCARRSSKFHAQRNRRRCRLQCLAWNGPAFAALNAAGILPGASVFRPDRQQWNREAALGRSQWRWLHRCRGYSGQYYPNSFGAYWTASGPYLQVMLSTGANGLETEEQVYAGCVPQDFAVGDITGDGIPDLVVVCNNSVTGAVNNLVAYYLPGIANTNGSGWAPEPSGRPSPSAAIQPLPLPPTSSGTIQLGRVSGHRGHRRHQGNRSGHQPVRQSWQFVRPYVNFDTSYGYVQNAGAADFNKDNFSDLVLEEYSYPNNPTTPPTEQFLCS